MIISTPVGNLEIKDNGRAITEIEVTDKPAEKENTTELQIACAQQLSEYFAGERKKFDLPVEFIGTTFQKSVWNALLDIPFGGTMTYGEIADAIGNPKAARAVGGACNKNSILIVVPCHRVIGVNGKLVGFACGLDMKSKLLDIEKYEVPDV